MSSWIGDVGHVEVKVLIPPAVNAGLLRVLNPRDQRRAIVVYLWGPGVRGPQGIRFRTFLFRTAPTMRPPPENDVATILALVIVVGAAWGFRGAVKPRGLLICCDQKAKQLQRFMTAWVGRAVRRPPDIALPNLVVALASALVSLDQLNDGFPLRERSTRPLGAVPRGKTVKADSSRSGQKPTVGEALVVTTGAYPSAVPVVIHDVHEVARPSDIGEGLSNLVRRKVTPNSEEN